MVVVVPAVVAAVVAVVVANRYKTQSVSNDAFYFICYFLNRVSSCKRIDFILIQNSVIFCLHFINFYVLYKGMVFVNRKNGEA